MASFDASVSDNSGKIEIVTFLVFMGQQSSCEVGRGRLILIIDIFYLQKYFLSGFENFNFSEPDVERRVSLCL